MCKITYTAVVAKTDSSDTYVYLYKSRLDYKDVIKRVWEEESGVSDDLPWYLETTAVYFYETEVVDE